MGAVAIYILNAVIYRPAAKAMDRILEQACVSHGPDDDEENPHIIPMRDSRGLILYSPASGATCTSVDADAGAGMDAGWTRERRGLIR